MSTTKDGLLIGLASLLVWQVPQALADDCKAGCSLERRACIGVARAAFKGCRVACKANQPPAPECRRACADAYRFAKLLCQQDGRACREGCWAADGSCARNCGGGARDCFQAVRDTARACRADCKQAARNDRAQCKTDFPQDPGPCLDAVGAAQSACLDGCGAAQEAGYQACRDTFDGCLDDCPPPDVPPKECNDLSGGLQILTERSTKLAGYASISWNSVFIHLGYTCGDPIALSEADLEMAVDPPGAAQFVEFVDNKKHPFTPLSPDPAAGTIVPGSTVTVTFSGLHYDGTCDDYIGTSHFKARVLVDKDLDGTLESEGYLGTNIHVEALADCP